MNDKKFYQQLKRPRGILMNQLSQEQKLQLKWLINIDASKLQITVFDTGSGWATCLSKSSSIEGLCTAPRRFWIRLTP